MTQRHSRLSRVARTIRDAWLILGISLVLLLGMELAYRGQSALRSWLGSASREPAKRQASRHPDAGEPWFQNIRNGPRVGGGQRFDPYRSWWAEPLSSAQVNVDSAGRRVTPQPRLDGAPHKRIFTFGGSTMWGWTARDSGTIPAFLVRTLHERGVDDVAVENFAQISFNLTQGVITLLLEVRRGNIPDVAVFLDGANEIATAWAQGRAGAAPNEHLAAEAYMLGRRTFSQELIGLGRHSRLVRRLRIALGEPAFASAPGATAELCNDIASYYANLVHSASAIGRHFGFEVVFFWQPILATTGKPLTPFEQSLDVPAGYAELVRACAAQADSLLASSAVHYEPLHAVFDSQTASMYTDAVGHLTEQGNKIVASRIADMILPVLEAGAAGSGASIPPGLPPPLKKRER